MYSVKSPTDIGINARFLVKIPISSHVNSPLKVSHIVRKVIVSFSVGFVSYNHLCARRISHTQVTVMGIARKRTRMNIRKLGTRLENYLAHGISSHDRHSKHPLGNTGFDIAGETSLERLTATH